MGVNQSNQSYHLAWGECCPEKCEVFRFVFSIRKHLFMCIPDTNDAQSSNCCVLRVCFWHLVSYSFWACSPIRLGPQLRPQLLSPAPLPRISPFTSTPSRMLPFKCGRASLVGYFGSTKFDFGWGQTVEISFKDENLRTNMPAHYKFTH